MTKALERQNGIFGTFIYENNGNQEKKEVKKIMENEENSGLIHKKVSEDQLVTFFQFSFGALSLFSLSLTLGDLQFSWSTLGGYGILGFLEQEGKGRA